ncbi:hypothetical protein [Paenibacillus faecis]|uniref:hypothetical protein n=1 Tax=Paenibacillus faecis TaxID=862114 RepID=UPI0011DD85CD|nr:hypothetical protein [Paenibacillus faecis]
MPDATRVEPLKISIDDGKGIILTSHRKLTLNAVDNISLYTGHVRGDIRKELEQTIEVLRQKEHEMEKNHGA